MNRKKYPPLPKPRRCGENPLIGPRDVPPTDERLEVACVFNCGAIRREGVTTLLLRVDERPLPEDGVVSTAVVRGGKLDILRYRKDLPGLDAADPRLFTLPDGQMMITVISHLRLARSSDGVHFRIDPEPFLFPEESYESYAVQDPRITEIDGTIYINYSAVSAAGIATALASTRDWKQIKRHGIIFAPDNRNVGIFPVRFDGRYLALHRPMHSLPIGNNSIWLAESPDLRFWGNHDLLMGPRPGHWDDFRVGGGPPPIRTPRGWLLVYHGSNRQDRYCLGAALLDLNNPRKILARHPDPLLEPEASYETAGFFGNVVFSCGAVVDAELLRIYYGASDELTCLTDFPLPDLLDALTE